MRLAQVFFLPPLVLAAVLPLKVGAASSPGIPARLSQTGLVLMRGAPTDPAILPYSPQYPLWSDGAAKRRWVFLPPGTTIGTSNPDQWDFPVGTKFWKEFSFHGQPAETRLIWKSTAKQWVYATYRWRGDGTDADLAPDTGMKDAVPIAEGKAHSLPSVADCKACHENGRPEILGFSALQLSTERDPLAPHAEPLQPGMVTLKTLADQDRLSPARPAWAAEPPRISAPTARARAALGYLHANCGSCHQAEGPNAKLALNFRYPLATAPGTQPPALATALGRPSKWRAPGQAQEGFHRIAPGHPELSTVIYRMGIRKGVMGMPQLATVIVDEEALRLIEAWIREDLK